MITDRLSSPTAAWLSRHSPVFDGAFRWISALPADPPDGRTDLRGDDMYVLVQTYDTKPPESCRWESHRHTIDIQYVIADGEAIDWQPAPVLKSMDDYKETGDVEHWHPTVPPATTLKMAPGNFVVFLPGELHRPQVNDGVHAGVRKLVVKINASLIGDLAR